MPRPNSVKKEYPLSWLYIVNYYLDNMDFYDYRSSLRPPHDHLTVGMEENGEKTIALTSTENKGYKPTKFKNMKDALLRWLQKRKVFNYIVKECPNSDMYRVKTLVDYLDCK